MKKWNNMPKFMKNKDVKYYYDILKRRKISLFLKRLFDIVGSLLGLIIFSPIMLILMIAIKVDSKGPIFYRQERVTRYGKKFKIFKFRTMIINADKIGSLVTLKDDSRITKVGNLIRKCRLDEFPQLINVLIGDMSFVGTRPEVEKYVKKYDDKMNATLLMRAGITSNASIKYRNEDKIINKYLKKGEIIDDIYINKVLPEKMKYNLEDIEKFNIFRELKICINTVIAVLK
mgnify:CR=1 FL=1